MSIVSISGWFSNRVIYLYIYYMNFLIVQHSKPRNYSPKVLTAVKRHKGLVLQKITGLINVAIARKFAITKKPLLGFLPIPVLIKKGLAKQQIAAKYKHVCSNYNYYKLNILNNYIHYLSSSGLSMSFMCFRRKFFKFQGFG